MEEEAHSSDPDARPANDPSSEDSTEGAAGGTDEPTAASDAEPATAGELPAGDDSAAAGSAEPLEVPEPPDEESTVETAEVPAAEAPAVDAPDEPAADASRTEAHDAEEPTAVSLDEPTAARAETLIGDRRVMAAVGAVIAALAIGAVGYAIGESSSSSGTSPFDGSPVAYLVSNPGGNGEWSSPQARGGFADVTSDHAAGNGDCPDRS